MGLGLKIEEAIIYSELSYHNISHGNVSSQICNWIKSFNVMSASTPSTSHANCIHTHCHAECFE